MCDCPIGEPTRSEGHFGDFTNLARDVVEVSLDASG